MTGEATDLLALKRLAEDATPGPWRAVGRGRVFSDQCDGLHQVAAVDLMWSFNRKSPNAAFIAAANPATILSLAALIEAQAAEIEEARRMLSESADLTSLCTTPDRFGEAGSGEVFLRMTAHNAQVRAFLASRTERGDADPS